MPTSADYGQEYINREFERLSPELRLRVESQFGASRGFRSGHKAGNIGSVLDRLRKEIEQDAKVKRETLLQAEEKQVAAEKRQADAEAGARAKEEMARIEKIQEANQKKNEAEIAKLQAFQQDWADQQAQARAEKATQEGVRAEVAPYAGQTTSEKYRGLLYPPKPEFNPELQGKPKQLSSIQNYPPPPFGEDPDNPLNFPVEEPVTEEARLRKKRGFDLGPMPDYRSPGVPVLNTAAKSFPAPVQKGFSPSYEPARYDDSSYYSYRTYASNSKPGTLEGKPDPNAGEWMGSPGTSTRRTQWTDFFLKPFGNVNEGGNRYKLPQSTFDPNAKDAQGNYLYREPGYKNTFWQDLFSPGNKKDSGYNELGGTAVAAPAFRPKEEAPLIPLGGGRRGVGERVLAAGANIKIPGTTYNPKYGYQMDPAYGYPEWPYAVKQDFNPGIFDKDFGYNVKGPQSVSPAAWNQIVNANFKTGPYAPKSALADEQIASSPFLQYPKKKEFRGFNSYRTV